MKEVTKHKIKQAITADPLRAIGQILRKNFGKIPKKPFFILFCLPKKCYIVSFSISDGRDLTRALQYACFRIQGGYPERDKEWTNGVRLEILLSNIGLDWMLTMMMMIMMIIIMMTYTGVCLSVLPPCIIPYMGDFTRGGE